MSRLANVWIDPYGEIIRVNIATHALFAYEYLNPDSKRSPSIEECQICEAELLGKGWFKMTQWPGSRFHILPHDHANRITKCVLRSIVDVAHEGNNVLEEFHE